MTNIEPFIIKGNKKICLSMCIAGTIIAILGATLLYASLKLPDNFCTLLGWATIILGLIIIFVNIKNLNKSLITIDASGILFNIVVFSKGIFIPWQGIINIDSEEIGIAGQVGWKVRAKCLVFTISESYSKKIPILLKGMYIKKCNKIYFAYGQLSISVDEAVNKIRSIGKGHF